MQHHLPDVQAQPSSPYSYLSACRSSLVGSEAHDIVEAVIITHTTFLGPIDHIFLPSCSQEGLWWIRAASYCDERYPIVDQDIVMSP